MVVISITITESVAHTIPGVPDFITISTNVPALIFFTLDGIDPNYNSSVYSTPIEIPQYLKNINLKVIATDGTSNSGVISEVYTADFSGIKNVYTSGNARFPQATATPDSISAAATNSYFPFGDNTRDNPTVYNPVGNPDNTIFNQNNPARVSNAFDGTGQPASFSNLPVDPFGSPPDSNNVRVIGKQGPDDYRQEISSNNDKIFNPKALVIYHDATNTDPLTPQIVNRAQFSLENLEGNQYLVGSNSYSTPTSTGSFIKSFYNSNTGKMTAYYRDSITNRWIISTSDFIPTVDTSKQFSNVVFGRENGSNRVYSWQLWQRRYLF